ncbi:methyltransferase domain-containing protein [Streptomyces sp. NPDC000927]|uniref:class I SAM-dependent methyltransferase n=1 Tax=Streptomyces sp. NPDC000927 TaxID=3154371 RepID=UPI00331CE4E8
MKTAAPTNLYCFLERLGAPPGILADIGGSLIPLIDHLQRQGWILHTVTQDQNIIRNAARLGVRTALRAPVTRLPLLGKHYDGVVLCLPDLSEAEQAMEEVARIARPGATVIVSVASCDRFEGLVCAVAASGMDRAKLYTETGEPLSSVPVPGGQLMAVTGAGRTVEVPGENGVAVTLPGSMQACAA